MLVNSLGHVRCLWAARRDSRVLGRLLVPPGGQGSECQEE